MELISRVEDIYDTLVIRSWTFLGMHLLNKHRNDYIGQDDVAHHDERDEEQRVAIAIIIHHLARNVCPSFRSHHLHQTCRESHVSSVPRWKRLLWYQNNVTVCM